MTPCWSIDLHLHVTDSMEVAAYLHFFIPFQAFFVHIYHKYFETLLVLVKNNPYQLQHLLIGKIEKPNIYISRLWLDTCFILDPKTGLNSPPSFIWCNDVIKINFSLVCSECPVMWPILFSLNICFSNASVVSPFSSWDFSFSDKLSGFFNHMNLVFLRAWFSFIGHRLRRILWHIANDFGREQPPKHCNFNQ